MKEGKASLGKFPEVNIPFPQAHELEEFKRNTRFAEIVGCTIWATTDVFALVRMMSVSPSLVSCVFVTEVFSL